MPRLPATGRGLLLRLPVPADLEALRELFDDPVACRNIGTARAWTPELLPGHLERWRSGHHEHGHTLGTVVGADDGAVLGLFGVVGNEAGDAELACLMPRRHWRRGHASRMMEAFLTPVREGVRTGRLVARVQQDHPARSGLDRLLTRHGFVPVRAAPFLGTGPLMDRYVWA